MDDNTAVAEVLAGNKDAFAHIVRAYHRRLYYYVAGKVPESGEAEDIVQKTFVTAFRELHTFHPKQPLLPWLRGIALNHCRNEWRQAERRARLLGQLLEVKRAELHLGVLQVPDNADDRRAAALQECLRSLSESDQSVLRLRFVQELSLAEIGEWLGRSGEAARLLLFRIRKRLRDCVAKKLALAEVLL